jgi:hypothetical protein
MKFVALLALFAVFVAVVSADDIDDKCGAKEAAYAKCGDPATNGKCYGCLAQVSSLSLFISFFSFRVIRSYQ